MAIMDELSVQLEEIRNDEISVTERRGRLFDDIWQQLKDTTTQLERNQAKLVSSEYTCEKLLTDLKALQLRISDLEGAQTCDSFALVLIDGDDTLFTDDLVRSGINGGHVAAQLLRKSVLQHLRDNFQGQHDMKLLIQVYVNMEGLSQTYAQFNIISEPVIFAKFVQGFNKTFPFCEFIDAGNDKEAADCKIKERIELFYRNVHCKHIILGASGDNSYTSFLRKYTQLDQVNNRLTLLQSKPFPQSLRELATKFKVTSFDLFKKTGLAEIRCITHDSEIQHKEEISSPSFTALETLSVVASSTADSHGKGASKDEKMSHDNDSSSTTLRSININTHGQRIDPKIEFNLGLVLELCDRRLCHQHFLTRCKKPNCKYIHDASLTPAQLNALRFLARRNPCNSLHCRDMDCVAGHRCVQVRCGKKGHQCRFPKVMHKVDTTVVKNISFNSSGRRTVSTIVKS